MTNPSLGQVRVRQLEWASEPPYSVARVAKLGLMYSTEAIWYQEVFVNVELRGNAYGHFPTVAEAKAAAQSDYEACILAALDLSPAELKDEGAAYEALARVLSSLEPDEVEASAVEVAKHWAKFFEASGTPCPRIWWHGGDAIVFNFGEEPDKWMLTITDGGVGLLDPANRRTVSSAAPASPSKPDEGERIRKLEAALFNVLPENSPDAATLATARNTLGEKYHALASPVPEPQAVAWRHTHRPSRANFLTMQQSAAVLAKRLEAAKDALKPFAEAADNYDPDEGDDRDVAWVQDFTIGSLRRARAALSSGSKT